MTLPNFLIIGAQKGGTTWLHVLLRQHPQVFMPSYEVHYFNHPKNYAKGRDWYERHFRNASGAHLAIGEKTPGYIRYDVDRYHNTAERIHELLPDAKLIAVLRNPVDRLLSAIHHHTVRGRFDPEKSPDEILEKELQSQSRRHIHHGYYYQGLRPFFERFPRNQILVLIYEKDLREDTNKPATAKRICDFLGIDSAFGFTGMYSRANRSDNVSTTSLKIARWLCVPPNTLLWRGTTVLFDRLLNQSSTRKRPSDTMLQRLYDLYEPENTKLFQLLGYSITEWRTSPTVVKRVTR